MSLREVLTVPLLAAGIKAIKVIISGGDGGWGLGWPEFKICYPACFSFHIEKQQESSHQLKGIKLISLFGDGDGRGWG